MIEAKCFVCGNNTACEELGGPENPYTICPICIANIPQETYPPMGPVTSPARAIQIGGTHYNRFSIQPWDAMQEWFAPEEFSGYLRGCALKYIARAGHKGDPVEDYKKAAHYLQRLIETYGD